MATRPHDTAELRALMAQAVRHQQSGQYAQAERIYGDILKQAPEHAAAHHFLGMLAHQTGRQELADKHMRRAVELEPRRAEFHFNYGRMAAALARHEDAAREFQAAVDIAPQMNEAWQGLGLAMRSLDMPMHAITCFMKVLEKDQAQPELWLAVGECFQELELHKEATDAYRWGQALVPADPRFRSALTSLAIDSGDDAATEAALRQQLSSPPVLPETHYQCGVWRASRGEFDAARAALQRALELAPDYYQAALYYSYVTPLALDSPLAQRLAAAAARDDWQEPGQGANVHFTLGYMLEKAGRYDEAFRHFLAANRLQRGIRRYSTASQRQQQRAALQAFGTDFLSRARAFGNPSAKPLFIVGMPRSGTSLLEQMLSSHPAVHGGGEMTFLHAELRRRLGPAAEVDFAGAVLGMRDADLAAVASALLARMDSLAPGRRHVTDKLPSNALVLGLIHALFPQARIVHCRRDALDTCVSCFTTSFKNGHAFSNDLQELGEYHQLYESAMQGWKAVLPADRLHEVSYEGLVADTETQLRGLLAFCGLEWDEACLHFQENRRAVATASVYQVRQPIYSSAVGRWQRYASHLGPLQEALARPALL